MMNDDNCPSPIIILSCPQMGENIGSAARGMLNFGLYDLRLVKPRDGWPNERATATASGAFEKMPNVKTYENLSEAIADLHFVFATTSRNRDMIKPDFQPQTAINETLKRMGTGQNIGFVFGAERTGLTNDELSLCQAVINIPTNSEFPSMNLAQSVLLLAYEWNKTRTENGIVPLNMGDSFPAKQGDINEFVNRLQTDLNARRFFRSNDLKPTMLRNIQNIFTRADITDQELRTLHGILSALRGNKKHSTERLSARGR